MLKNKALLFSAMILPIAVAYGSYASKPLHCLSVVSNQGQWIEALTITNQCDKAVNLRDAMVKFNANVSLNGAFWGDFSPLAYPKNPKLYSVQEAEHYVTTALLDFPDGNKWWKPVTVLPINSSIQMRFGVTPQKRYYQILKSMPVGLCRRLNKAKLILLYQLRRQIYTERSL